jgi:hypothetical protein
MAAARGAGSNDSSSAVTTTIGPSVWTGQAFTTCLTYSTCETEGQQWFTRTCVSCSLTRRLGARLDDGSGQVSPALKPMFEKLTSAASPMGPMTWFSKPAVRRRLTDPAVASPI